MGAVYGVGEGGKRKRGEKKRREGDVFCSTVVEN